MHQLGLSAADLTSFLQREAMHPLEDIEKSRQAHLSSGVSPELAEKLALIEYLQAFSVKLLEANNHKIAADLVRLGVLTGTLLRDGEASF